MHHQLPPVLAYVATESTRLFLGLLLCLKMALFYLLPQLGDLPVMGSSIGTATRRGTPALLCRGVGHPMLSNQMLHEIILSEALVITVWHVACPPL